MFEGRTVATLVITSAGLILSSCTTPLQPIPTGCRANEIIIKNGETRSIFETVGYVGVLISNNGGPSEPQFEGNAIPMNYEIFSRPTHEAVYSASIIAEQVLGEWEITHNKSAIAHGKISQLPGGDVRVTCTNDR